VPVRHREYNGRPEQYKDRPSDEDEGPGNRKQDDKIGRAARLNKSCSAKPCHAVPAEKNRQTRKLVWPTNVPGHTSRHHLPEKKKSKYFPMHGEKEEHYDKNYELEKGLP
jgi:hypothetical protein